MKKFITIVFVLATGVQVLAAAPSDTCVQATWVTNGTVRAIVPAANKIYIGGDFTWVGPYTGGGLPVNSSTAAAAATFPKINGTVSAVCADGSGGWFVGGTFTLVDGVARNNIAHITAAGIVDAAWNPNATNTVSAIAVRGSVVYIGGAFTSISGTTRNYIASVDAVTGLLTSWNPAATGTVSSIAVNGTSVYVGGTFNNVGGQTRMYIACIDSATGTATSWNPAATGSVSSIAVNGTRVYAGGTFNNIGGQTRMYIACIDSATGTATTWNPNAGTSVLSIAVSGAKIFAGGNFITIGGQSRNRIACLDTTIGAATTWDPNASASVSALAVNGNTVYAGGAFRSIGGQPRNCLAGVDTGTGAATTWDPYPNNTVSALAVNGSMVFAGGTFTSANGQPRKYAACIDASTGIATSWAPNINNFVYALAVNGNSVYCGGLFTTVATLTRNYIACVDAVTGAPTSWDPNANTSVNALAVNGTSVYAGGSFATIGGQTRTRIACLDSATGTATNWAPNANVTVYSLAVNGHLVYAGGYFTTIGGQTRNRIACIDSATGLATTWNPDAAVSYVMALAAFGNVVYAGGTFTTIGGLPRNRIACINATDTGTLTTWDPNADGSVNALAVNGTGVYAGGNFGNIGGQLRNRIACLGAAAGLATTWNPDANSSVYALAVSGATVYAGGLFTSTGQGIGHTYFAQFGNVYPVPTVVSIAPSSGINNAVVQITNLNGTNFRAGASVKLMKTGQPDIIATGVSVLSSMQIICSVDITNAATGTREVVIVNEDSNSDTLVNGFTIVSAPPALVSPVNNATNCSLTPTLTWRKVPSDSLYTVQFSSYPDFLSLMVNSTAADTFFSVPAGLLSNNAAYYWKVRSIKKGGEVTAFCVPWSFTTIVAIPSAITLKLPATSDTVKADSTILSWSKGTPAVDKYWVEYGADSSFAITATDSSGNDTVKILRSLTNNTSVWWRVSAHNAAGWGAWSAKNVFIVKFPVSGVKQFAAPKTFSFAIASHTGFVKYALPNAENVSLKLYSLKGQLMSEPVEAYQGIGYYSMDLQRNALAAGSYVVVFKAGEYRVTKMVQLTR